MRSFAVPLLSAVGLLTVWADDTANVVFKSEVALVRVDAQVVDRDNRAITGLTAKDFILREEGRPQPIRNFASEEMPIDVLLLLDVSASMRPHVRRISSAAHQAFGVLAEDDRIAIMVFDRSTRVRMPFRGRDQAERELERLLDQENFRGGTDITRGLLDAADYIRREGRTNARRAIVILTDDQTEFDRDEERVSRALERANAVLSFLQAPDAMSGRYGRRRGAPSGGGYPGGGYPGGGYPGGGYPGGPLGGVIWGRRGGGYPGGGRYPGGGASYPHTHSAGTAEIARRSGGDVFPVDNASALEDTLARLRQRYALHFLVPPDAKPGQERTIELALAGDALRRYPGAEIRYRRTYYTSDAPGTSGGSADQPVIASQAPAPSASTATDSDLSTASGVRRRRAVNEDGTPIGGAADSGLVTPNSGGSASTGGWRRSTDDAPAPATPTTGADQQKGGWRRVKPGEQP
jgi:VWFA-related protein